MQQLVIRNDTSLPLALSLQLVVANLPEGVELANDVDTTEVVSSVGSPVADVIVEEESFLSPGNSVTVTLMFRNYDEVPITYTPKLYSGLNL